MGLRRRRRLEALHHRRQELVAHLVQIVELVVVAPAAGGGVVDHRLQGQVRHRADQVEGRRVRLAQRRDRALSLVQVLAAPGEGDDAGPAAAQLRRERPLRRRGQHHAEGRQLTRGVLHDLPGRGKGVHRPLPGVGHHPAEDHRADRARLELEARDDAEVAAAAAQGPEEVRVLLGGSPDLPALREHHLGGPQRVDRQAVVAHQPPDAATQGEAADPGMGDLAGRHREAVLLGRRVELAEQGAAADAHATRWRGRRRPRAWRGGRCRGRRPAASGRRSSDRLRARSGLSPTRGRSGRRRRRPLRRAPGRPPRAPVHLAVETGAGFVVVEVSRQGEATGEAVAAEAGGKGRIRCCFGFHARSLPAPARDRIGHLPYSPPPIRPGRPRAAQRGLKRIVALPRGT